MIDDISKERRFFLGAATATFAMTQFGLIGQAQAKAEPRRATQAGGFGPV